MSFSDFDSDLTELSSDEEIVVPLAQVTRTRTRSGKGRDYQIKGSLRPPRTSQFSAKALYGPFFLNFNASQFIQYLFLSDQIVENTIDLDPEYQRGKHSRLSRQYKHRYNVLCLPFHKCRGRLV